jgi:hypothetical protein
VYSLRVGGFLHLKDGVRYFQLIKKMCEHGNPSSFLQRIFTNLKYLQNTFKKFFQMFYM